MYETFYNLTATPFRLTPDPRFCFSHSSYAGARAYLQYAFELGEGFIILTGRPGAGKTTLIESFLKELETGAVAKARIATANLETSDLLRLVAFAYDIEAEGLDKATVLRRLAQHFSALMHRGWRVLLVIDEAQGLSRSALEELRLLADLQEDARPLLQIFLVGQEKLRSLMREPDTEQLQQRVIGTCRLGPMGLVETKYYVRHRLCRAGWTGDPELTGAAILAIFQYSGGIPRHINKICTRLLLQGFLENKHILDKDDVQAIAGELDEEQLAPMGGNGQSLLVEAADGPVPVSPDNPVSLSDLAVRVLQPENETPPLSAPSEVKIHAETSISHSEPVPAGNNRVAVPSPPLREYVRPTTVPSVRTVAEGAWHRHPILMARVLPGLIKLQEKPAVLFGMVAAVTVSAAAVTSYFENHVVKQQRFFVVNTQPLQPVLSATQGDESREAAAAQGAQPELPGQDMLAVAPTQRLGRQVDDIVTDKETGVYVASPVSRQTAPVSAAAVEVSPGSEADQGGSELYSADQPDRNDAGVGGEGNAQPPALVVVTSGSVSQPERVGSHGQTKAFAPGLPPEAASPAADAVATDTAGPVALAVSPSADDSTQPLSGVQKAVASVVSPEERIAELLLLAGEALREDRLLIPAERSAYDYYQQVLSLEPGDTDALSGLGQIVERYITLARRAIQSQNEVRAKRYIARALRVRPRDERLLALEDSMNRVAVNELPERRLPAVLPEPPPEEPKRPKNVFQRLKDFFSRNSSVSGEE